MSTARLSDHEIEALLDREHDRVGELEELEVFIAALDRTTNPPTDTYHMGTTLAAITRATAPQERRGSRRLAPLGAMTAIFMATTGIAFAADASAPGDPLYRIDRALESIGIGDGGLDERVAEYEVLVERGDDDLAQQLVDDVVAESAMSASAFPRENGQEENGDQRSDAARQGPSDSAGSPADDVQVNPADRGRDSAPGQADNPGQGQENQGPGQNQGQGNIEPGENQGNQEPPGQDQDNQGQGQENQGPGQNQGNQTPGENQGNQEPPGQDQDNQGQGQENQGPGQNQGNQTPGENQGNQEPPGQDQDNQGQGQENQGPGQNQGNQGTGQQGDQVQSHENQGQGQD